MAKLCLGTVQFGMKYGINNKIGPPSKDDTFEMLDIAIENGITKIDTASAYGIAEELLGEYILKRKYKNNVEIISKLRPNILDIEVGTVQNIVKNQVRKSLHTLQIEQLDGYLLHTPQYIYNQQILDALQICKKDGLVKNIGISIYEIQDGFEAINTGIIDYVQLPYSVFDQRGEKDGFLVEAKKNNIEVYTRSAFLQGLTFMQKDEIPQSIEKAKNYLEIFDDLLKKYHVNRVNGLLNFVADNKNIDYLVLGVDNKEQLIKNIKIIDNYKVSKEFIEEIKEKFQYIDKNIILPSLWAKE